MNPNTEDQPQRTGAEEPFAPTPQAEPTAAQQPTQNASVPSYSSSPIMTQSQVNQQTAAENRNKKKKLALIIAAVVLVLGGGSAAAYFGIIVPNKPENLWKSSLENTAKGYDKLVEYGNSQKDIKGGKLKGTFKFESKDTVVDGNIESQYDDKVSVTKIDAGLAGTRFNLELMTNIPEGTTNPDIYAKVSGLKGIDSVLGAAGGGIGQSLEQYDNQWYTVDHTLFDQYQKSADNTGAAIQPQDVVDFAKAAGEVNREYLFTTKSEKAVFSVKENVGKETVDNRSVYHYKVAINKENAKAYSKALCEKVVSTKFYKAVNVGKSEEDLKKECSDTGYLDDVKDASTADVWVDTKTRLIRKTRFTDSKNTNNYVDVGLDYNGGDEYPFVISVVGKDEGSKSEGKAAFRLTLNTKKNNATVSVDVDGKEGSEPIKFTLKATLDPSKDKVEFKKPEGVKSLLEAFGGLFGGFSAAGSLSGAPGTNGNAANPALMQKCTTEATQWAQTGDESALSAECRAYLNF
jgi:hypothetical protein